MTLTDAHCVRLAWNLRAADIPGLFARCASLEWKRRCVAFPFLVFRFSCALQARPENLQGNHFCFRRQAAFAKMAPRAGKAAPAEWRKGNTLCNPGITCPFAAAALRRDNGLRRIGLSDSAIQPSTGTSSRIRRRGAPSEARCARNFFRNRRSMRYYNGVQPLPIADSICSVTRVPMKDNTSCTNRTLYNGRLAD